MAAGAGGRAAGAGKVWIVTGANSGIGVETAKGLVADGHRVIGAVRDTSKRADLPDSVELRALDLSSLESVRQFVRELDSADVHKVHGLVANAGIMHVDGMPRQLSKDGFELQMATNHVGHCLLVELLHDKLAAAATAEDASRVVILASGAHRWANLDVDDLMWERPDYRAGIQYGNTKLCNVLAARYYANRYRADNITCVSVHPGVVLTNLSHQWPLVQSLGFILAPIASLFLKTPAQGASTSLFVARAPELSRTSSAWNGRYFADDKLAATEHAGATDDALAEKLMERTHALWH
jgi:NAD(P)-dependent dehydrogenase (short-subunit alcohol dehydrogenase family)